MDNIKEQTGAAEDPFEESLRQILSNDSAKGGRVSAFAVAPSPAPTLSPAERRAADDATAAAKIQSEQKVLFWLNLFRPLAFIAVLALLGWFVLRISNLGG